MTGSQTHQTSSSQLDGAHPDPCASPFTLGEWQVDPDSRLLKSRSDEVRLQALQMRVLCYLCAHADRAVSREELVREIWQVAHVSEHAVQNTISSLRRALGDTVRAPRYIRTDRLAGYRIIGAVSFEITAADATDAPGAPAKRGRPFRWRYGVAAAIAIVVIAIGGLIQLRSSSTPSLEEWLADNPGNWEVEVEEDG